MKDLSLTKVFSSPGRAKILQLLVEELELNITQICRRASVHHTSCVTHLKALCEMGFLEEKIFGNIKIYRFKTEDPNANALKKMIDLWKES